MKNLISKKINYLAIIFGCFFVLSVFLGGSLSNFAYASQTVQEIYNQDMGVGDRAVVWDRNGNVLHSQSQKHDDYVYWSQNVDVRVYSGEKLMYESKRKGSLLIYYLDINKNFIRQYSFGAWENREVTLESDGYIRFPQGIYASEYNKLTLIKRTSNPSALNVSCSASPNPANTNQSVTFSSSVTGGTGSNTYSWSGACSGSSQSCNNSFSNAGTQSATVTVTSGTQTGSANCSVNVNQQSNPLSVSCYASPSQANTNQAVNFIASASGGSGYYTYSWSGACSGSSSTCSNSFNYSGMQTATVFVTSNNQTGSANCSVTVSQQQGNRYLSCYNNDLYWYDSILGRQELSQDCGETSCGTTGTNYCVGNSIYQQRTCYSRGCAGNACYNTSYSTSSVFIQNCSSGQTCQNGYCVNNQPAYIIHSYKWCYNNSVYWYDSNNARQELYQACSSNQTCQTSYCENNYQPAPAPSQYKGCYNNDIYWFSSSTNVRLNFFQSCQDQNSCTLDSCANGRCSNILKCDGTTCSKGSVDYCSNCNHVGDGICNCGETIDSAPEECGVIGLALTLFGKRENDTLQWSKNFTAEPTQKVDFLAVVSNGQDTAMNNVTVRVDFLPEIIYKGDLKLDGASYNGDIKTGINLGSLNSKAIKTLTFKGEIAPESSLTRNETDVMGTVSTSGGSSTDSIKIAFIRGGGQATTTEKRGFLAALFGVNISKPVYILLGIIIVILVIMAIRRIMRTFRKEE